MTAQKTIQRTIDAQQEYDAIVYGLRSIKVCGSVYCTGPHAAQLVRAAQAARRVLGRVIVPSTDPTVTPWLLAEAKKLAAEDLKAAKAAKKEFGGIRQLRLALTEASELAVAA